MENLSPCPSPRPSATSKIYPRRAVTLPLQQTFSNPRERRASFSGPPDPQVETLYSHSSVRIVAFTASAPSSLARSTAEASENGTLPWSSKLERTIAIGQMRIYRPPGSVAFLSCGSVIKPILPKSQCWCVDEEGSKFVLLIRSPQFWRIELSIKDPDAKLQLEEFKETLTTILFFEKTVCPFARSFTIQLPEPPKGPIIKKPWRPVEKPKLEMVSVVEISQPEEVGSADEFYSAPSETSSLYGGDCSDDTDDTNATRSYTNTARTLPHDENNDKLSLSPSRPKTAPQMTVVTPDSSGLIIRSKSPLGQVNTSLSSSTESFQTAQCWHSPLTPFPPPPAKSTPPSPVALSYNESQLALKYKEQNPDISDINISPATPGSWDSPHQAGHSSLPPAIPQTPSLVYPSDDDNKSISTVSEVSTPPRPSRSRIPVPLSSESKVRHRATTSSNSRRRTLSPLPSPASMFSPQRQRQRQKQLQLNSQSGYNKFQARQLPGMVIRKTCEILLSPPSHLINIMLNIAAKISAGEWKGGWLIWGGRDDDLAFEVEEAAEMVDDFGYDLIKNPSSSSSSSSKATLSNRRKWPEKVNIPGSWTEID